MVAGIDEAQIPWGRDLVQMLQFGLDFFKNKKWLCIVHSEANAIMHRQSPA